MKTTTFRKTIHDLPSPNPLTYPACFFENDLTYTVVFPDFNGAIVETDGYDNAKTKAFQALHQVVNAMMLTDRPLPVPTSMDKINPTKTAIIYHIHYSKCLIVPLSFHF